MYIHRFEAKSGCGTIDCRPRSPLEQTSLVMFITRRVLSELSGSSNAKTDPSLTATNSMKPPVWLFGKKLAPAPDRIRATPSSTKPGGRATANDKSMRCRTNFIAVMDGVDCNLERTSLNAKSERAREESVCLLVVCARPKIVAVDCISYRIVFTVELAKKADKKTRINAGKSTLYVEAIEGRKCHHS